MNPKLRQKATPYSPPPDPCVYTIWKCYVKLLVLVNVGVGAVRALIDWKRWSASAIFTSMESLRVDEEDGRRVGCTVKDGSIDGTLVWGNGTGISSSSSASMSLSISRQPRHLTRLHFDLNAYAKEPVKNANPIVVNVIQNVSDNPLIYIIRRKDCPCHGP
jgi:hypothetical protein